MKKIANRLFILLGVVLLLVTSCSKEIAKSNYTDVVPANATEVMLINLDALTQKAGFNSPEVQGDKEELISFLVEQTGSASNEEVEKIFAQPAEAGIDYKAPVYLFKAPSLHTYAMSLKVNNYPKLDAVIQLFVKEGLCSSPKESSNHLRVRLNGTGIEMAYNDGTLLVVYHKDSEELNKLSAAIDALMQQKAEKSLTATVHHQQVIDLKGDIGLFLTPDALPLQIRGLFSLPQGTQLIGSVLFTQGKLVALLKRSDFNGEVYISSTPFRPQSTRELQAALYGVMRGKPFHLELGSQDLLTLTNLQVLMEFSPDDESIRKMYQLILKIEKLTLQGDNNLCVLTVDLTDKQENALKQIIGFAKTLAGL